MAKRKKKKTTAAKTKPVVEVVEADEAAEDVIEVASCAVCGKPLLDAKSIERGIGPVCWTTRDQESEIMVRLEGVSTEEPPDHYVPLEKAIQLCSDLGVPVGRLVKAMGGDRMKFAPRNENFTPMYVGKRRKRYLPEGVMAEIPDLLEVKRAKRKKKKGSSPEKAKATTRRKRAKPKTGKRPVKKAEPKDDGYDDMTITDEELDRQAESRRMLRNATRRKYAVVAENYGLQGKRVSPNQLKAYHREQTGETLALNWVEEEDHWVDSEGEIVLVK